MQRSGQGGWRHVEEASSSGVCAGRNVVRAASLAGGRVELRFFLEEKTPEHFAREAARGAIAMLDASPAPAVSKKHRPAARMPLVSMTSSKRNRSA